MVEDLAVIQSTIVEIIGHFQTDKLEDGRYVSTIVEIIGHFQTFNDRSPFLDIYNSRNYRPFSD